MKSSQYGKWFVSGDIDGFFGLALDNLVQLLVIHSLCDFILGFPSELLYSRVMPGVAISLVIGNLYYAWQARRISIHEKRNDVCALPYGINTPSVFAYVFLVMLPVKLEALSQNMTDLQAAELAWQAGLVACFGSGIIELCGAFVAERIRKITPRAALLSTLAGIAMTFIAMPFIFKTFANPIVGFTTFGIILAAYFGGIKFKGNIPAGLVAVVLGTVLAMITGLSGDIKSPESSIAFHLPVPVIGDLVEGLQNQILLNYLGIIIPMGIFNVIGSMQNIESAEAEGDQFPTGRSLAVNGIGTIAAALFGSCFPTTIYIGHPGWKQMGARVGYSILNAVFMAIICLIGFVSVISFYVPIEAGMAIVIWIGVVITAQAFTATPLKHAPAVVIGLLPGIAAWGVIMVKTAMRVSGQPMFGDASVTTVNDFHRNDVAIDGGFAMEQGFILSAMIFSAITVYVIEKQFYRAAIWSCFAGLLSSFGIMHAYRWTLTDTVVNIHWPWNNMNWEFVIAYVALGLIFAVIPFISKHDSLEDQII